MKNQITAERERIAFFATMEPIASLLADERITDIMLNAPLQGASAAQVFVEVQGKGLQPTDIRLTPAIAEDMLREFAQVVNAVLSRDRPQLSCQPITGGTYRVEAKLPPAVAAPTFTIRKHDHSERTLEDYVNAGTFTTREAAYLTDGLAMKRTILIGGEMGSGKSTAMNALLQVLATHGRRIVTIEDTPELVRPNALTMQMFVDDEVFTYRDALRSALRDNAEHIVLGELREGAAALKALEAWRSGHKGMTTLHGGSSEDMLERLYDLCLEASERVRPRRIARSIDICIHMTKNRRLGTHSAVITEVKGWDDQTEQFVLEPPTFADECCSTDEHAHPSRMELNP